MKKILIGLILISFLACEKGGGDCQTDQSKRSGARCNDGTSSGATGSGACSTHGGVDYWICK